MQNSSRKCAQCGLAFFFTKEDDAWYRRLGFEPENLCFECLQKQMLCFRNARKLYHRKCDATGEDIISIFSPDKPYKVYSSGYWYGDQWDPLDYGQDFDFTRPFFEQLAELKLRVPLLALTNINAVNSPYCNSCVGNKNSYLVFGGDNNEDTFYGDLCMNNRSCVDLDLSNYNELCYMLGDCLNCYGSQFAFDSKNCNDCAFISDCSGCSDCILSTNLVNKSYCIRNQQYSQEEYFQKKKELLNGSFKQQQKNYQEFLKFRGNRTVKYAHLVGCENCTGDYIKNSKNCHHVFDVTESEDLRNIIFANKSRDCFNACMLGEHTELSYRAVSVYNSYSCQFSFFLVDSAYIDYSYLILNSRDLFGCVGLRQKQFCILNKQYSEKDYKILREKIIEYMKKTGEWARFFPGNFSCFGYNETTAYEYYPLAKQQALREGFNWKDDDVKQAQPQVFIVADVITAVPDSVVNEILVCSECRKNFKVIIQELDFYRRMNIPVPRMCADCRFQDRSKIRNPRKLWPRTCQKCSKEFQSSYAHERTEIVYCEHCYLGEMRA